MPGGCPTWGQPPTHWDWLGCDAKKPAFLGINLSASPDALSCTLRSLSGLEKPLLTLRPEGYIPYPITCLRTKGNPSFLG